MMLSATAKTSLCTMFAAVYHAGLVRPEDKADFLTSLENLQAELTADEDVIADHEKRILALEDLDNGEEAAIDPAAPLTLLPTAILSTDPAHSPVNASIGTIITTDASGSVLATPVLSGDLDPATMPVTVNPISGIPVVGEPTADVAQPILGETVLAPAGTPAPDDPTHVGADTSTVVATADPEPAV